MLEFDLRYGGPMLRLNHPHRASLRRRPLLVYGKPDFRLTGGDDVIEPPPPDRREEARRRWHANEVAMAMLVERFTRPGQVVCDPFLLGWRGTALGAREHGCIFIGAERDRSCLERTRRYLVEAEGEGPC